MHQIASDDADGIVNGTIVFSRPAAALEVKVDDDEVQESGAFRAFVHPTTAPLPT